MPDGGRVGFEKRERLGHRFGTDLVVERFGERPKLLRGTRTVAGELTQDDDFAHGVLAPGVDLPQAPAVLDCRDVIAAFAGAVREVVQEPDRPCPQPLAGLVRPLVVLAEQKVAAVEFDRLACRLGAFGQRLECDHVDPDVGVRIPTDRAGSRRERGLPARGRKAVVDEVDVTTQVGARLTLVVVGP